MTFASFEKVKNYKTNLYIQKPTNICTINNIQPPARCIMHKMVAYSETQRLIYFRFAILKEASLPKLYQMLQIQLPDFKENQTQFVMHLFVFRVLVK